MFTDEKAIEDWVCENIPTVVGDERAELVDRQITLPSGKRLDVLAITPNAWWEVPTLTVIEVKKDKVGGKAVSQLMRYMGEVEAVGEAWKLLGPNKRWIHGVLVAPGLTENGMFCVTGHPGVVFCEISLSIGCRLVGGAVAGSKKFGQLGRRLQQEVRRVMPPAPEISPWEEANDILERHGNSATLAARGGRLLVRPRNAEGEYMARAAEECAPELSEIIRRCYPGGTTAPLLPKSNGDHA